MKLITPKLPKWHPDINECLEMATDFIHERYGYDVTNMPIEIKITKGNRGRFYSNMRSSHIKPYIQCNIHNKLYLYTRKTVGLTTPEKGLHVGYFIGMVTCMIHEITHFIQYIEGRRYSEVETTQNEVDYLERFAPDAYERLERIDKKT